MTARDLGPRVASFRASFFIAWSVILPLAFAAFAWDAADLHEAGVPWGRLVLHASFTAAKTGAVTAAVLYLAIRAFPVHVHRGGVVGFGVHGFPASMRWEQIAEVSKTSWFGVDYLELATTGRGRRILVPCDLARPNAFIRCVAAVAGREHPLARLGT